MNTKLLFLSGFFLSVILGCTKADVPEKIPADVFPLRMALAGEDTVMRMTANVKPAISFQVAPYDTENPSWMQPIELLAQLNSSTDVTPYVVRGYVTKFRSREPGTGGGDYVYGSMGDFELVCTGRYSQKIVLKIFGEELNARDYFSVVIESITPDATYEVFDSRAYGIPPF